MIVVNSQAPDWAHEAFAQADDGIALSQLGPFVSLSMYSTAAMPDAVLNANKIALLSDGTFWLAKSDGADWLYPDNTTV